MFRAGAEMTELAEEVFRALAETWSLLKLVQSTG